MQELFPESVEVPYGLVHFRLFWGLPAWMFAILLVGGVGPLYLWGWEKWWVSAGCLVAGGLVAKLAYDDPQFLTTWVGEINLKHYYD